MHEFIHSFFHIDSGIFFTIKELFTRPGKTIKEFLQGKRIRHFKPFLLLIIISIATLFSNSIVEKYGKDSELIHIKTTQEIELENKKNNIEISEFSFANRKVDQKLLSKNWLEAEDWLEHHHLIILITIPIFAFALFVFFKFKRRYNFSEFMVIATFIMAQYSIIKIVFSLLNLLFPTAALSYFAGLVFFIWTMFQLFDDQKFYQIFFRSLLGLGFYVFLFTVILALGFFVTFLYSTFI